MEGKIKNIPPQNIDAERSLLGAMMLDRDAISSTVDIISKDSFYKEIHSIIYSSIIGLFERGEPVDALTVLEDLKNKGKLEQVGGGEYLSELVDSVVSTLNAKKYAEIIEEKRILRELIKAGNQIIQWGYDENESLENTLAKAEKAIFELSKKGSVKNILSMKQIMKDTWDYMTKMYDEKRKGFRGLSSGFSDLDKITGGFHQSELIVLASRPSMGKSSLALNMAYYIAIELKKAVAIFSLEMSAEQVALRLLSSGAEINGQKFRSGVITEREWKKAVIQYNTLSNAPIFVVDTQGLYPVEIRSKARRIQAEQIQAGQELALVIVDYLQLINAPKRENRVQEISEISRELKSMARELNVPVLALSQLSRAADKREDKRPQLSDLRESGAIEQDADLVIFIYRPYSYEREDDDDEDGKRKACSEAEIIVAKNRNGQTGKVKLVFRAQYAKFELAEKREL